MGYKFFFLMFFFGRKNLIYWYTYQVQYNPLDAGALVEGGKVIGQNSFKMAGQVTLLIGNIFEQKSDKRALPDKLVDKNPCRNAT